MFEYISRTLSRRKLNVLVKRHEDAIDTLRNGLYTNLAMDAAFSDFPRILMTPTKETTEAFDHSFRVMTNLAGSNNRVSIVVRRDHRFIGTLVLCGNKFRDAFFVLPNNEDPEEASDRVIAALEYYAIHDASARGAPCHGDAA